MTTPVYGPPVGPSNLSDGVSNDTVLDSLRRFLPPAYRNKPGWEALMAAFAAGDEIVRDNVFKAFNQLFLSAASGNYLIQRAADQGIVYPDAAGITEELFRELAVLLANERQIAKALLGILEVFYGEDATRARLVSAAGPFDLQAGDTIVFRVDDRTTVTYTADSNDFDDINAATPTEVAGALTRAFLDAGVQAYAITKLIDGTERVVVYSGAIGLLGSLAVTGGFLNRALQLSTPITWTDTYAGQQWLRTRISLDEFRLTWTQDRAPGNLNEVQVGDFATFDCVNSPELRGYFTVSDVHISADPLTGSYANLTWFSIVPTVGFPWPIVGTPATTFQVLAGEIVFFRPERQTVTNNPNPSFIAQHDEGVDVVLPAITQAVGRAFDAAAYLHDNDAVAINQAWKFADGVVVQFTAPPPFGIGDVIELEGIVGTATPPFPPPYSNQGCGGWNLVGKVSAPPTPVSPLPANSLWIAVDNTGYQLGHGAGGSAYALKAPVGDSMGPYVFDTEGFAVTGTETACVNPIGQGTGLSALEVGSTAGFPDGECWIVVGFGFSYESGPIRCLGTIDGTNLAIDRSYSFPHEIPAGASVTLLSSKGVFEPADGSRAFILTDSVAGRIAASDFIDETAAAGIPVNKFINYPGDRGLGGEGDPTTGIHLSDKIIVWASDDVDQTVEDAHGQE